jgi:hypothetical protein
MLRRVGVAEREGGAAVGLPDYLAGLENAAVERDGDVILRWGSRRAWTGVTDNIRMTLQAGKFWRDFGMNTAAKTNVSTPLPASARSKGRVYLWMGIGLCLLGIAAVVAQYSLKLLIVPWYLPVLTTLAVFLLVWALATRFTVVRAVVLGLIAILAGLEWLYLGVAAKLPEYTGPAEVGKPIPAFQSTLANGRSFTQRNLQDGKPSVLVFFRGRW